MVSRTLFRATKSSAHTPLDNFCSVIEPLSSILQIQIQIQTDDLNERLINDLNFIFALKVGPGDLGDQGRRTIYFQGAWRHW